MALPREPRQKMINIMYLVLTAILALNVSNEVINAFKVVDNSLITTNSNISASNAGVYKSIEAKLNDPQSAERARIWQPLAMNAKQLSDSMTVYLDSLKLALKKAADLKMRYNEVTKDTSVEDFRQDNLDASTRMFETNGEGERLKARLEEYKALMLKNPIIKARFEKNFPVSTEVPKGLEGHVKDFTQTYFHMTPTVAALTMLSKFQNNVKNAENEIVSFCASQIGNVEIIYNKFQPIAVANSTYLMPGQEITVTAGVGAFNDQSQPVISIGGVPTPLNNNGVAERKFNVSGSGTQKTHVHITYKNQEGKLESLDKDIEYTVGTPGGAAVMLDKMNVFYIGVDNPVSISSGTGWDKTHVSMSGGTITPAGTPGKFIVKVSAIGKAEIIVNADGKASTYPFRIKAIPDPIIMVGPSSGGRIQSVVFKNQPVVRADLKNFDFEAKFSVVSATIYFTGAGFPTFQPIEIKGGNLSALTQMSKCIPGTTVIFDNIKVQGPDGAIRTIQNPPGFALY